MAMEIFGLQLLSIFWKGKNDMKCSKCGISLSRGVRFCPNCGNNVRQSKAIKYLLAIVLCEIFLALFLFSFNRVNSIRQVQKAWTKYQTVTQVIDAVESEYTDDKGFVSPECVEELLSEVSACAEQLYNDGHLSDYSYTPGDTGVYMEVNGWLGAVYMPEIDGMMSGGAEEVQIYTFEPNDGEFEFYFSYILSGFDGPDGAAKKISDTFERFDFGHNINGKDVTIASIKEISPNSIIVWIGHGGCVEKLGSVLCLGTPGYDQYTLLAYQRELADKALCLNGDKGFCITSVFFDKYMPEGCFDGSLVYLGTCSSAADPRLAESIFNKGARAVLGNSKPISIIYNFDMVNSFFEGLASVNSDGSYMTVSQALEYAKMKNGENDIEYMKGHAEGYRPSLDPMDDFWRLFFHGSEVRMASVDDFTLPDMLMYETAEISTTNLKNPHFGLNSGSGEQTPERDSNDDNEQISTDSMTADEFVNGYDQSGGVLAEGVFGNGLSWKITLPDGLLTISGAGEMPSFYSRDQIPWADYTYGQIKGVFVGSGVTNIGKGAFAECAELEKAYISDGAENIGEYSFGNCVDLNYVRIPDSVTVIEEDAFWACCSLAEVTLPKGLKELRENAFYYCAISKIDIPSTAEFIDSNAFTRCVNLSSVSVSSRNTTYVSRDNVIFSKDMEELLLCPDGKTGDYEVPDGVVIINNRAFGAISQLSSVSLPDTVIEIGTAFCGCEYIENISLSKSLTKICGNAFHGCDSLKTIVLPESVGEIEECAFYQCTDLHSVTIPEGVKEIKDSSFYQCFKLEEIYLPASIEKIGFMAFDDCDNIKDIYYAGSKEQWSQITIDRSNDELEHAVIHFGYSGQEDVNNSSYPEHENSVNSEIFSSSPDYSLYIPVIEKAISEKPYPGDDYGILYDIDRDGTNELLILHEHMANAPEEVFSIYDIEKNSLIAKAEYEQLFVKYGGGGSIVGIAEYEGKEYILASLRQYGDSGYIEKISFYDYPSMNKVFFWECSFNVNNRTYEYALNRSPASADDYNVFMQNIRYINVMDTLTDGSTSEGAHNETTLSDIMEQLRNTN